MYKLNFENFLEEFKKEKDNEKIMKLKEIEDKISELKPFVDKYYELNNEYNQKKKSFDKQKKYEELFRLKRETKYNECEYPSMGCEESNGSVEFKSKKQAESLLNALRSNSNYYYSYILKWDGVGQYIIKPDWKYDHDKEIVYTATIKKED